MHGLEYDKLEAYGVKHTFLEWEEITGIKKRTLQKRVHQMHWTAEKALTQPVQGKKLGEGMIKIILDYDAARRREIFNATQARKKAIEERRRIEEDKRKNGKWVFVHYTSHSGMYKPVGWRKK